MFFQKPQVVVVHGKMCANSSTTNTTQVQMKATPVKFLIFSFYPTPIPLFFSLTQVSSEPTQLFFMSLSASMHFFLSLIICRSKRVCMFCSSGTQKKDQLDSSLILKGLKNLSFCLMAFLSSSSLPRWPCMKHPFEICHPYSQAACAAG